MASISLSCSCGAIKGVVHHVSPTVGNRVVCYCDSCRNFCKLLGASYGIDEYGGIEVYQVPIGSVEFSSGRDKLKCLRLTENGAFRWYASCCNTPIGNTGSASLPMMGVIHTCIEEERRDEILGPVRLDSNTQDAPERLPLERRRGNIPMFVLKFLSQMIYWRLCKSKSNPVFNAEGNPIVVPSIGAPE